MCLVVGLNREQDLHLWVESNNLDPMLIKNLLYRVYKVTNLAGVSLKLLWFMYSTHISHVQGDEPPVSSCTTSAWLGVQSTQ